MDDLDFQFIAGGLEDTRNVKIGTAESTVDEAEVLAVKGDFRLIVDAFEMEELPGRVHGRVESVAVDEVAAEV